MGCRGDDAKTPLAGSGLKSLLIEMVNMMAKSSQGVIWKNATKLDPDFETEPLKGLWKEYEAARDATTNAFKQMAEKTKLEAKEEAFKAGLLKQLKQMAPDNPLYPSLGIPAGKTRQIALKYGIAVSDELFDENASRTGSSKGIKL